MSGNNELQEFVQEAIR